LNQIKHLINSPDTPLPGTSQFENYSCAPKNLNYDPSAPPTNLSVCSVSAHRCSHWLTCGLHGLHTNPIRHICIVAGRWLSLVGKFCQFFHLITHYANPTELQHSSDLYNDLSQANLQRSCSKISDTRATAYLGSRTRAMLQCGTRADGSSSAAHTNRGANPNFYSRSHRHTVHTANRSSFADSRTAPRKSRTWRYSEIRSARRPPSYGPAPNRCVRVVKLGSSSGLFTVVQV
jgi:hypothetical protein